MTTGTSLRIVVVALALAWGSAAQAVFNDWTNSAGGEWENTANWSLGHLPDSTEDVRINASGTYTVHIGENAALNYPGSLTNKSLFVHNAGGHTTLTADYTNPVTFYSAAYPGSITLGNATVNWNTTNTLSTFYLYMNFSAGEGTQAVINVNTGRVELAWMFAGAASSNTRPVVNVNGGYFYMGSGMHRLPQDGIFTINLNSGTIENYYGQEAYGQSYPGAYYGTGRIIMNGGLINNGYYYDSINLGGAYGDSRYGGRGELIISNGDVIASGIYIANTKWSSGDCELINGHVLIAGTGLLVGGGVYDNNNTGGATGTLTIAGGTWDDTGVNGTWNVGRTSNTLGQVTIATTGTVTIGPVYAGGDNNYNEGIGEIYLKSGTVTLRNDYYDRAFVAVGCGSNSIGRLFVTGGSLDLTGFYVDGGFQIGNLVYTRDGARWLTGVTTGVYARGEVTIDGGAVTGAPVTVGSDAGVYPSTFAQHGGIMRVSRRDDLGSSYSMNDVRILTINKSGAYTLKGGTLEGGLGSDLIVAGGTFLGYGDVGLQDQLVNDGRILADGQGTNGVAIDRTLSFTNLVGGVTNSVDNASSNGWFAINQGKLVLPTLAVSSGNSTVNWGEAQTDGSIDLVNSARIAFTGASAGNLGGALCASNHTAAVPIGPIKTALGTWQFTAPAFTSATVTFRYDDALATQLGIPEGEIEIFGANGGLVTAGRDTAANTITSQSLTSLAQLTVGTIRKGSLILIR